MEIGTQATLEQSWAARLLRARELGQTPKDIAREHGVAESTVYAWRRRIQGPVRGDARSRLEDGPGNETALPRFAKVERVRATAAETSAPSGGVMLEVAGVRLTVTDAAGIALAMQVVQALRELA